MTRHLFLLAESRSGSNWLTETLNSHSSIHLHKEILQPRQRIEYYENLPEGQPHFTTILATTDYLRTRLQSSGSAWSGCKILFPQIRFFDFYDFFESFGAASFIVLERENPVRAEFSGAIARSTRTWHLRNEPPVLNRIAIDPAEFLKRIRWRILTRQFVKEMILAYGARHLSLTYESLFADIPKALGEISSFLSLAVQPVPDSSERRGNPFLLRETISNYDEVDSFFRNYPELHQYFVSDDSYSQP